MAFARLSAPALIYRHSSRGPNRRHSRRQPPAPLYVEPTSAAPRPFQPVPAAVLLTAGRRCFSVPRATEQRVPPPPLPPYAARAASAPRRRWGPRLAPGPRPPAPGPAAAAAAGRKDSVATDSDRFN